jgi:hypothetical protein
MAPIKKVNGGKDLTDSNPTIQGKAKKPESLGKIEELRTIIRRFDDDGITIMEGMNVPGAGVVLIMTKKFKESAGGGITSSSAFLPHTEIVMDNESGANILWEMGTGGMGITRGPRPPEKEE